MPSQQRTPSPSESISYISTEYQPAGDHPRQNELTLLGEEKDRLEVEMMLLEARATKASSSSQPAGKKPPQNELTLLREKDQLEEELITLKASIDVRRVKLLEEEVKNLRAFIDRMNAKVKRLQELVDTGFLG